MATQVMEEFMISDTVTAEAARVLAEANLSAREERIERLGLRRQRQCSVEAAERFYGSPLIDEELKTWTSFLPTKYSQNSLAWIGYTFDTIPDEVLEQISTADSLRLFHDIQIWTPEQRRLFDPMAVGVVYGPDRQVSYFPIVRWGEALATLGDIKEALDLRHRFIVRRTVRALIAWMLMVTTLVSVIVAVEPSRVGLASPIFLGVLLFVFGSFAPIMWIDARRDVADKRFPVKATMTPESLSTATG